MIFVRYASCRWLYHIKTLFTLKSAVIEEKYDIMRVTNQNLEAINS